MHNYSPSWSVACASFRRCASTVGAPFDLDRRRLRRHLERAAESVESAAVLGAEVGARLLERLDLVRLDPQRVLDLGCATGRDSRALSRRFPNAQVLGVDPAPARLRGLVAPRSLWSRLSGHADGPRPVAADPARLPLAAGCVDLAWSNLFLHFYPDPAPIFAQCHRVLRPEGLLLFSTLGPDTLHELRRASLARDGHDRVHPFIDMHDLGDLLAASGFADPVMEMERITLTYPRLQDLLADLRAQGATHAGVPDRLGLASRGLVEELAAHYEAHRVSGRLPATFEVVYGHAWRANPAPRRSADGRSVIQVDRPSRRR